MATAAEAAHRPRAAVKPGSESKLKFVEFTWSYMCTNTPASAPIMSMPLTRLIGPEKRYAICGKVSAPCSSMYEAASA